MTAPDLEHRYHMALRFREWEEAYRLAGERLESGVSITVPVNQKDGRVSLDTAHFEALCGIAGAALFLRHACMRAGLPNDEPEVWAFLENRLQTLEQFSWAGDRGLHHRLVDLLGLFDETFNDTSACECTATEQCLNH